MLIVGTSNSERILAFQASLLRYPMRTESSCILNSGGGAWAFAELARSLSEALWVDVSETPREYNYLLSADDFEASRCGKLFIPLSAMQLAADKRLLAEVFAAKEVPTPATMLAASIEEAERLRSSDPSRAWCLKFPTGCGASGHRHLTSGMTLPPHWPHPLVVQEFIRLEHPEVFRLYGARGQLFGWVARRFPAGARSSDWVAHANGARYEQAGEPPAAAITVARAALEAVGLLDVFGCVDLLQRSSGEWVALEVGTDGMFNHVDRDLGIPELECEIQRRIAEAFWARLNWYPWGVDGWRPRPTILV